MLRFFSLCSFFILLAIFLKRGESAANRQKRLIKEWGYINNEDDSLLPQDWYKNHPKCNGTRQSPINVQSQSTIYNASLGRIEIKQTKLNDERGELWELKNNGFSVVITPMNHRYTFVLQPENEEFKLLQMHFHWRGSEHRVDGHIFPAELHMVHQSTRNENRFTVLGFFFSSVAENNPALAGINDNINRVSRFNSTFVTNGLTLGNLIQYRLDKYFRYPGSLTTPGCDEVVEWILMEQPVIRISEEQLLDFQLIADPLNFPILTNSRPPQPINARLVKRSFQPSSNPHNRDHLISASGLSEQNSASFLKSQYLINFFTILVILKNFKKF